MPTRTLLILTAGSLLLGCLGSLTPVGAQTYERVQPIVLTGSSCCTSPARIPLQPAPLSYRGASYTAPSVAESLPEVTYAAEVAPLPPGMPSLPSNSRPAQVVEYRIFAPVVSPTEAAKIVYPASEPAIPSGYVVGKSLLGQPKLFKPGEPVKNFLRYISL